MFSKGGGEALAKNCDVAFLGNNDFILFCPFFFLCLLKLTKLMPSSHTNFTSKPRGGRGGGGAGGLNSLLPALFIPNFANS